MHEHFPSPCSSPPRHTHLVLLLGSFLVYSRRQSIRAQGSIYDWILVHVLEQDGLADGGAVVHARAAVAVPA